MNILIKLVLPFALLVSCLASAVETNVIPPAKKIQVVTTLPILKDIVENIGGTFVQVESLANPNQDAHFVQPKPTLMKKVNKADLFVEVGLSLELWAQKLVDSSGNSRVQMGQPGRLSASDGLRALEVPQILSRDFGDVHPHGNPHVWLDPINVKKMALNIKNALVKVDPVHKMDYEKNLINYEKQIDIFLFGSELLSMVGSAKLTRLCEHNELQNFLEKKKLTAKLGGWLKKAAPLRNQELVTYHKSWVYLANRLDFKVPIEIEDKPGIASSAKHRDEVVSIMQQKKIGVILMEIYYDRYPAAEYIAKKTNATIVQTPIDVGAVKKTDTYLELMNYIVDQLLATRKFKNSLV